MEKCLIIGSGGHCRVLLSIIFDENFQYEPIGIIDEKFKKAESIMSIPIIGDLSLLDELYQERVKTVFIATGNNAKRKSLFDLVKSIGFKTPNLISQKTNISKFALLGTANVICPFSNIGPMVKIGNNNIINTHSNIEHETQIGHHCHIGPNASISGRSKLGDLSFLGAGATVIEKINISSETLVGAGSVIIEDIKEPGYMYAGVPATKKKKI